LFPDPPEDPEELPENNEDIELWACATGASVALSATTAAVARIGLRDFLRI
jgi:hypothetical protein